MLIQFDKKNVEKKKQAKRIIYFKAQTNHIDGT